MMQSKVATAPLMIFGVLLSALSALVSAEPLRWHYQWITPSGEPQSVSVPFSKAMVDMAYLNPRDMINYKGVSKHILGHMAVKAASLATDDAHVLVEGDSMERLVLVREFNQGKEYLATLMQQQVMDYAREMIATLPTWSYFYQDPKKLVLMLDYNAIADDYRPVAMHLVVALSDALGTDNQDIIAHALLDLLQSLEYNDMDSEDFPLFNPARMLLEQEGDCESKQLLLAMGLKVLYPHSTVSLIALLDQEHIVLALEHPGQPRIYMDATGPERLPMGALPPHIHLEGSTLEIQIRS